MSSSLKTKVDEDVEEYERGIETALDWFKDNEENSYVDQISIIAFFKDLVLAYGDYLLFKKEANELNKEALGRIEEGELDIDQTLFLLAVKRALVLKLDAEDHDYLFQSLAQNGISITRDSFTATLEQLPPLKTTQRVMQAMIDTAGGFPISKSNFKELLVLSGFVDQKVKALDSILNKKNRSKARKRSKKS